MAIVDRRLRPQPVADLLATASGRAHRSDPVLPRTGGPAGNARLTAWLGLVLLVLFAVECVTLLSLRGLISLHIGVGTALVPIVLAKTAVTGWRIMRYYGGDRSYADAGPPPVLLRLLGPLVVVTGLAVLGSGLALVPLGREGARGVVVDLAGRGITALAVHKLSFLAWLVVVGAHTLARTVPALRLAAGRTARQRVSGGAARLTAVLLTVVVGVVAGVVVTQTAGSWTTTRSVHGDLHDEHDGR